MAHPGGSPIFQLPIVDLIRAAASTLRLDWLRLTRDGTLFLSGSSRRLIQPFGVETKLIGGAHV